jgi:hypothetical protein
VNGLFNKQTQWHWNALTIFLAATLGYMAWRWSSFIVWDDTSTASFNKYSNNGHFSLDHIGTIVREAFGYIQGDGYRPLSAIIRGLGSAYVYSVGVDTQFFIIVNAVLCGMTAVAFYGVSGFFLRTLEARIFAMFLFFASPPVLTGGLVLFSGIQFLVFFSILGILWLYLRHDNDGRFLWLVLLGFLLLIGPWVREFVGVAPALIIVREALYRRGIRPVGMLAVVGFAHALFPTLLPSLFASGLPVVFVFQIGNLGNFMATPADTGLFGMLARLHWRIIGDIFSIVPPTLMLLGLVSFFWSLAAYRKNNSGEFRKQIFLFIFFGSAFVPFLKLFNEQVHLAYSLIPLSLLLAMQFEFLRGKLRDRAFDRFSLVVTVLFAIAIADHAVNIFSVRQATREIYGTIMSLADRFSVELPKNSIIISNAHHIEDIRFYSRGHIDPWVAGGGMPDKSRWLTNVDSLQRQLTNWNGRAVYFLDVRLPKNEDQRGADRFHSFVRDDVVPMTPLGKIAATRYTYPFFDPLRLLLSTKVAIWPGPPDLEFDFYRGPALSGDLFQREVAVDYMLYKVTGDKVRTWLQPALLAENHFGFNLVGFHNVVYAIPQSEGAFDLARIQRQGYSRTFKGVDVESVKESISRSIGKP